MTVSGNWTDQEKLLHINVLELKAVFLALKSFQNRILDKRVLIATDNATVVSYLNKQGGTHSWDMCLLVWCILAYCNPRNILIRARHIQGCLNVIADSLSRKDKIIQTEWSLHPQIFSLICKVWHTPMVDMFATKLNHKLPIYVSPVPDANAINIDALNISWEGLDGYAFCPVALIPKVIQKMNTYRCRMIVAPGWPRMHWFWDLVNLSTKPPLQLPHWPHLLKQPFSQKFHQNLVYLNLHVWHLDTASFSEEVADRIKAPQRPSSRRLYESRWAIFELWCQQNKVVSTQPSISDIAEFLNHLFTVKNLKPATIAGY